MLPLLISGQASLAVGSRAEEGEGPPPGIPTVPPLPGLAVAPAPPVLPATGPTPPVEATRPPEAMPPKNPPNPNRPASPGKPEPLPPVDAPPLCAPPVPRPPVAAAPPVALAPIAEPTVPCDPGPPSKAAPVPPLPPPSTLSAAAPPPEPQPTARVKSPSTPAVIIRRGTTAKEAVLRRRRERVLSGRCGSDGFLRVGWIMVIGSSGVVSPGLNGQAGDRNDTARPGRARPSLKHRRPGSLIEPWPSGGHAGACEASGSAVPVAFEGCLHVRGEESARDRGSAVVSPGVGSRGLGAIALRHAPQHQDALARIAGEAGRALELHPGLGEAPELGQEIAPHAGQQVVVLERGLRDQRVGDREPRPRPESHRHRHRAVELDDR